MPQLNDTEYINLSQHLEKISGIKIPENKRYLFSSRLDKRLSQLQLTTYNNYYQLLLSPNSKENEVFVNAMTTNLSYFFREPHHFKTMLAHLSRVNSRQLKIGSFGCSTGEEPISIAISLLEHSFLAHDFKIFASDIDTDVLTYAKKGLYGVEKTPQLDPKILTKYFKKIGHDYQVVDQVLRQIEYNQINITKGPIPFSPNFFDVIFCRNALIYFPSDAQKLAVGNFSTLLKTDGILCLGHAELLTDMTFPLSFIGQSTYKKI